MKRNILFIIPWLPYPMVSGGHQALYNGILAIKNDFNVFVVYEKQTGNDEAENHFHDFFPNVVLLPFSSYKMPLQVNSSVRRRTDFLRRGGSVDRLIRLLSVRRRRIS